ncbi:MAG: hypothetical protein R3A52_23410 [Polyangiales bacterium]
MPPEAGWTWRRLARVGVMALAALALVDLALAGVERREELHVADGELRNSPGIAAADATRRMLLRTPEALRRRAVAVAGSSVSFGAGVPADQSPVAFLADALRARGDRRAVFNLSQHGGGTRAAVPVVVATAARPVAVVLVEFAPHNFAEGKPPYVVQLGDDEVPLVRLANAAQRRLLEAEGYGLSLTRRIEADLAAGVFAAWRAYRIRGRLWVDEEFQPIAAVWSARRAAAGSGLLPARFQGGSTNVRMLPWRRLFATRAPGAVHRLHLDSGRLSEREYALVTLIVRLARAAGQRVVFFEAPFNLALQRHFGLMDATQLERWASLRAALLARMRADGVTVVEAPAIPDDGFMDQAHLTPLGGRVLGEHLADVIAPTLERAP